MAEVTDLIRSDDHWELPLGGCQVTQLIIDYAVTLVFDGDEASVSIAIEGEFTITTGSSDSLDKLDPEGPPDKLGPVTALLHREIETASAFDDGHLQLRFTDDRTIRVLPGREYEAWNFSGPEGVVIVSTPGGSLAVWNE